jgi:hypothetical protein
MVSGAADLTMSVSGRVAEFPFPSVTLATKLKVPAVDGVPEIEPVWTRDKPGGRVPLSMTHVNSGLPPIAANVLL